MTLRRFSPQIHSASKNNIIAFIGPTMSLDDTRQILAATYVGPIARNDLPAAVAAGFRRIVIIDGLFEQQLSVSLVELRQARAAGCEVIGGASMGALRAVEAEPLGVVRCGIVADAYADGRLECDDEVGVATCAETFRALSDALVNIRWVLGYAVGQGTLTKDEEIHIGQLAQRAFYPTRGRAQLKETLLGSGESTLWQKFNGAWKDLGAAADLKRLDALNTLRMARSVWQGAESPAATLSAAAEAVNPSGMLYW